MNKKLLVAFAVLGMQLSALAQDITTTTITTTTETAETGKSGFYLSAGVVFNDGFKLNNRLQAAGMPTVLKSMPELSIGYYAMYKKVLIDLEWNTGYYGDRKTSEVMTKTLATGFKFRGHYVPVNTGRLFLSGGLDISYVYNKFDIYNRDRVIDLNDLDPANYSGHISLNNEVLFVGPSVAFGAFQQSNWPLRLNVGYEWAVLSSKWRSEFASVSNTLNESGTGRFYTKLTLYL